MPTFLWANGAQSLMTKNNDKKTKFLIPSPSIASESPKVSLIETHKKSRDVVKVLLTLTPFVTMNGRKVKYCVTCANLATQEACFDVGDNVTSVEKYCDACAMTVLR